jgi:hypothetical protein
MLLNFDFRSSAHDGGAECPAVTGRSDHGQSLRWNCTGGAPTPKQGLKPMFLMRSSGTAEAVP